jgi:hypothetical protein
MAQTPLLDEQKSNTIALWDRIGIGASTLCLIHCILTPVLLGTLPLLNLSSFYDERIHQALAVFIVVTCGFALVPGFRRHGRWHPARLALAGVTLLLAAAFIAGPRGGEAWEMPLTVAGGLFMVSSHLLNLRLTQRCDCCAPEAPAPADA